MISAHIRAFLKCELRLKTDIFHYFAVFCETARLTVDQGRIKLLRLRKIRLLSILLYDRV